MDKKVQAGEYIVERTGRWEPGQREKGIGDMGTLDGDDGDGDGDWRRG